MDYYTFMSSMVPLGSARARGLIAKALWGGVSILVAYYVGHYIMRGLGALWRRR